ncbi:DUF4287 domain-containing protein [Salmonirosea aquatica]|uniref:DUF4287 domain-containing protein n=1 Tax=Salmonirosea aquatica TaxID=2654236 RepID=A0A7C9F5B4_9BACT|nr:DUF4287 domain-containing protein [Cytophagaceae bacterium SJW1-29]
MSFQAYLDNIKAKTGKTPEDFKKLAEAKGFFLNGQIQPSVKAGEIVKYLKEKGVRYLTPGNLRRSSASIGITGPCQRCFF